MTGYGPGTTHGAFADEPYPVPCVFRGRAFCAFRIMPRAYSLNTLCLCSYH